MRIIVEGADQQGKSTLCSFLAEELGFNVIHFAKPDEQFNFVSDYMIPNKTISDRNYLSEIVYSKIRGDKSRVQRILVENMFKSKDTLLILVDRGDSYVFDKSRHEDYTEEQISKAINIYREEFDKVKMHKLIFNPSDTQLTREFLASYIKHETI